MLAAVGWALFPMAFGGDVVLCGVLAVAFFLMGIAFGFSEGKPSVLGRLDPVKRKTGEKKESKEE